MDTENERQARLLREFQFAFQIEGKASLVAALI
jgi:hypothetical protein